MARSARQFFQFARFDPDQPVASEATYARLIRKVVSVDPYRKLPEEKKIVIPGYQDLYTFSRGHEALLKKYCGGAWQSYFQRGHWRMVFPFTRRHQDKTVQHLLESVKQHVPPVVHLVRFPSLSINHAMLVIGAEEGEKEIQFITYDPNDPETPIQLVFDRVGQRFFLPTTGYFAGGRVDVYQVYCGLLF